MHLLFVIKLTSLLFQTALYRLVVEASLGLSLIAILLMVMSRIRTQFLLSPIPLLAAFLLFFGRKKSSWPGLVRSWSGRSENLVRNNNAASETENRKLPLSFRYDRLYYTLYFSKFSLVNKTIYSRKLSYEK